MASTLQINNLKIHVFFYPGATHSFITSRIIGNLGKEAKRIQMRFRIGTPINDVVETNSMYVSVKIDTDKYDLEVNLIPLELNDFDVILGMDWLSKH